MRGSDKINSLRPRRKNKTGNKSYCTAWTTEVVLILSFFCAVPTQSLISSVGPLPNTKTLFF